MPRPCCLRHINHAPAAVYFKPTGVPACTLQQVILRLDEVEALRLADLQGLYQEQAAVQMQISRPTFARIIETARQKVAEAIIHGKALRIEGGTVILKDAAAPQCGHRRRCCGKAAAELAIQTAPAAHQKKRK